MNLSKALSRRTLLIATLTGVFALSLMFIIHANLKTSVQKSSPTFSEIITAAPKRAKANYGLPARLLIPKINVDAAIDPMGLTKSGDMEAPTGPRNVGWYRFGTHPGNIGSAVIDGHYGRWKNGEESVFDDLHKLRKGDKFYVEDEKGAIATFVVRDFRTYDPNADTKAVFRSSDGLAHLNLITCEGVWNEVQKSFSDRFIIFADKK